MSSKLREALEAVYECAKDGILTIRESAFENVLEALEEPIRNCDVGSSENQAIRFREFCSSHKEIVHGMLKRCKKDCPAKCLIYDSFFIDTIGIPYCQFKWAQLPYEEVRNEQ
jgi:hypothetical protein